MSFKKSLIIALFALIMLGSVYAAPGIPHQFYGFATINGNVANSANIVAKIDGTEVASTTTTITTGNYGISPNIFYVTDPNGTNAGKTIEFFLNDTSVATYIFKNGELTELNLALGTAPTCGDGTCSGGETCSTCAADCGACGGSTSLGGGGGGGGGGGSPSLTIKIEGECVGQEVTISTLNSYGNPSREASVLIRSGNTTVFEETTDDDGQVVFTFDEAGEYTVFAVKQFYTQNSKVITISECAPGETTSPAETETAGNLCENINCDDNNPCTSEICATATGHCIYNNEENGTQCSLTATCQEGICTEPEQPETDPTGMGPTGFFGLGAGQMGGIGLIVLAIIAMTGYLFALNKKKSK